MPNYVELEFVFIAPMHAERNIVLPIPSDSVCLTVQCQYTQGRI